MDNPEKKPTEKDRKTEAEKNKQQPAHKNDRKKDEDYKASGKSEGCC